MAKHITLGTTYGQIFYNLPVITHIQCFSVSELSRNSKDLIVVSIQDAKNNTFVWNLWFDFTKLQVWVARFEPAYFSS